MLPELNKEKYIMNDFCSCYSDDLSEINSTQMMGDEHEFSLKLHQIKKLI